MKEIERKFLVSNEDFKKNSSHEFYRQGYIMLDGPCTVRVRRSGERAYLTIKSNTIGITRDEFEYEIPLGDADYMLDNLCIKPVLDKYRYTVYHAGKKWVVDEFLGEFSGLLLAEIELESEDESFEIPPWLGKEVTGDKRYYNSNMVKMKKNT